MEDWHAEIERQMDWYDHEIRLQIQILSKVIRHLAETGGPPDLTDPGYLRVQERIAELRTKQKAIEQSALQRIGVSDEEIEHLIEEQHRARITGTQGLIKRSELIAGKVESTNVIEDILPGAIEKLLSIVDPKWLLERSQGNLTESLL